MELMNLHKSPPRLLQLVTAIIFGLPALDAHAWPLKIPTPGDIVKFVAAPIPAATQTIAQQILPKNVPKAAAPIINPSGEALPKVGAAAKEVGSFVQGYAKAALEAARQHDIKGLAAMSDPVFYDLVAGIHTARKAGLIKDVDECNKVAHIAASGAAASVDITDAEMMKSLGDEVGERACKVANQIDLKNAAVGLPVSLPPGTPPPPTLPATSYAVGTPAMERIGADYVWIGGCEGPGKPPTLIRSDWHVFQYLQLPYMLSPQWVEDAIFARDPYYFYDALIYLTIPIPGASPVYGLRDGKVFEPNIFSGPQQTGTTCQFRLT